MVDPLETFMGKHGLTFNAKMNCACKSQKKLPVEDLAMDTGFMNRGEFHTVYMNLVNDIGQAMASCEKVVHFKNAKYVSLVLRQRLM